MKIFHGFNHLCFLIDFPNVESFGFGFDSLEVLGSGVTVIVFRQ
jgi:hypothetical protein